MVVHKGKCIGIIKVKDDFMFPGEKAEDYLARIRETYEKKFK